MGAYEKFHDLIMEGKPALTDAKILRKDGTKVDTEFSNTRVSIVGTFYMHTVAHDITEQRQAIEQLEMLKHSIDNHYDGAFWMDTRNRFVYVNQAACKALQYDREELLGMHVSEVNPVATDETMKQVWDILRTRRFFTAETAHRRKDGTEFPVEIVSSYVKFGDKEFNCGFARDVTERKRAEEALLESQLQYRATVEQSDDGITIADPVGHYIMVNRAFCKMTGYTKEELLKMRVTDMISKRASLDLFPQVINEGKSGYRELSLLRKDGTTFIALISGSPLEIGNNRYVQGIVRDITERKHAEEALRESEERYRLLFNSSLDGILLTAPTGEIFSANPAVCKMLDRSEEEICLLGRDGVVDISDPRLDHALEERANTGRFSGELTLVRKDGSKFPAEVSTVIYKDRKGIDCTSMVIRDITERKRLDAAVRETELRYRDLVDSMTVGYYKSTSTGRFIEINPAFCQMVGYSREELLAMHIPSTLYFAEVERIGESNYSGFAPTTETYRLKKKDGSEVWVEDYARYIRDETGRIIFHEGLCTDITYRKALQEQLLQSQKLESIGQLAGGIAHDYNNILGVVIGYAEFLRSKLEDGDNSKRPVDAILAAANRGSDLTRQLLAFARKEMISPKVINMNSSIESIEKMLRRVIGENLKLTFVPGANLWNIKIDPSQFDQLMVNLATNSRDAIKGTGVITIKTENTSMDENEARDHLGITAGDYVKLTFQDTGRGMDKEMMKKIFEPFFTTKPKGQGTGLGLSTVYGIVKQNNGDISVMSKPGEGTMFEIFLPRIYSEVETEEGRTADESIQGTETILVVEDQADLLEIAKASLEKYGYKVITALEPGEGLLLSEDYAEAIHLLLTDVVMPTMSGKELSDKIAVLRPGIKTLFMSGYTANELAPQGILKGDVQFIQKPFTPSALAKKVHETLTSKVSKK